MKFRYRDTTMNREILRIGIPSFIENTLQTCVGFIDSWMIARIGLFAVTAVGSANAILNVYLAVFIAIGVGTSSLISRNIGSNKHENASYNASQGFVISLGVALVFSFLSTIFGRQMLNLMGIKGSILEQALLFLGIVGGGSIFIATMTILSSILRAQGNTKEPMKVSFLINVINIAIDYCLIFGMGPIPALGVIGTAIGTVVSRIIGSIILLRLVQESDTPITFKQMTNLHAYKEIISLTIPATLERLAMRLGQVLYFGLIVSISANTFAAHSIAGNIESFTYMPAYGLATAAATLVGFSIGKNDASTAKKYAIHSVYLGVSIMSVLGIVLFIGAPQFASIFTQDVTVIKDIVTALRIDALFQPSLAISIILVGALQGMGDTKSPLFGTLIGMWVIRVSGVYLLGNRLQMGIAGIWLTIGIDLTIRSIFLTRKLHSNTSKRKPKLDDLDIEPKLT